MNFGLLHTPSPDKALAESFRVLRKKGRLAFTLWASPEENPGARIVDDLYGDSLGGPGSGAENIEAMLLSNARKIAEALK